MKKSHLGLLLLFIPFMAMKSQAQITNPAPYCAAPFNHNYNMINNIVVKGTTLSFGAMGSVVNTNTYKYYNNTTFPTFNIGDTASLTLNVYSIMDGEPIYFALWIDYNNNNTFETSEIVMQNSNTISAALPTFGAPVSPINKTITIPATASVGTRRARLMRAQHATTPYAAYNNAYSLGACPTATGNTYGCTYDFNVTIAAASANVLVNSITVQGQGNASTITTLGGSLQMQATVLPANATNSSVTWSVTNGTGTATINSTGMLTAQTNGTVTVKATANDASGVSGTKVITISNQSQSVLVNSITVQGQGNATTITTNGGTLQMQATVLPANATNSSVTWSVVNGSGMATISSTGLLTALTNGIVTVKATANDASGISGTKVITISNQGTAVNDIELNNIKIYPNPTSDKVHLDNLKNDMQVAVYDIMGRKQPMSVENTSLDFSGKPSGTYIISITDASGTQLNKLINVK